MKINYIELLSSSNNYYNYIGGCTLEHLYLNDLVISEILGMTKKEYQSKMITKFNAFIRFNEILFNKQIDGQLALKWVIDKHNDNLVIRKLMGENITENDTLIYENPNRFNRKCL